MSHIVIENCIKCKFTDCVNVCPVDCFHEGNNFLVIDPEKCIDCAVCIPECPIEAIIEFQNDKSQFLFENLNLNLSKIWPIKTISNKNTNLNEKWKNIRNKLHLIDL